MFKGNAKSVRLNESSSYPGVRIIGGCFCMKIVLNVQGDCKISLT